MFYIGGQRRHVQTVHCPGGDRQAQAYFVGGIN